MMQWIAHEDGGFDVFDNRSAEQQGRVCDTLIGISTSTKGNAKDLGALRKSA
jgi:phosphoheptose isomerase